MSACYRCKTQVDEGQVCSVCHPLTTAAPGQVIDMHWPTALRARQSRATEPCKRHRWVEAEIYGGRMGRRCERCETEE